MPTYGRHSAGQGKPESEPTAPISTAATYGDQRAAASAPVLPLAMLAMIVRSRHSLLVARLPHNIAHVVLLFRAPRPLGLLAVLTILLVAPMVPGVGCSLTCGAAHGHDGSCCRQQIQLAKR